MCCEELLDTGEAAALKITETFLVVICGRDEWLKEHAFTVLRTVGDYRKVVFFFFQLFMYL